jgi:hypothetical protein
MVAIIAIVRSGSIAFFRRRFRESDDDDDFLFERLRFFEGMVKLIQKKRKITESFFILRRRRPSRETWTRRRTYLIVDVRDVFDDMSKKPYSRLKVEQTNKSQEVIIDLWRDKFHPEMVGFPFGKNAREKFWFEASLQLRQRENEFRWRESRIDVVRAATTS